MSTTTKRTEGGDLHHSWTRASWLMGAAWLAAALAAGLFSLGARAAFAGALLWALALGAGVGAVFAFRHLWHAQRDERARLQGQLGRLRLRIDDLSAYGASVAHDLRAPLTPIRIRSQLIALSDVSDDVRANARKVDRAAERMGSLIDGMLALARQDGASCTACTDVSSVAYDVVDDFEDRLRQRGARIDVQISNDTYVACESEIVASILQNLVENAIKHGLEANRKSDIELRVSQCGRLARISVEDHGRGIAKEISRLIFLPGVRSQVSAGCGIGLATVRRLVERRGGSVQVVDGRAGGACFTVELPLASPTETAAAALPPA